MGLSWANVGCGAIRFTGKAAMRQVLELIRGDDDYAWSIPGGWPAPFWIDVYPSTQEARAVLLEVVDCGVGEDTLEPEKKRGCNG